MQNVVKRGGRNEYTGKMVMKWWVRKVHMRQLKDKSDSKTEWCLWRSPVVTSKHLHSTRSQRLRETVPEKLSPTVRPMTSAMISSMAVEHATFGGAAWKVEKAWAAIERFEQEPTSILIRKEALWLVSHS